MDAALSDASTISEDRMRAALQSSGPSPSSSNAPRGRHRFVQDGEVPVTVLNARHRGPEELRAATADLERSLAAEREARGVAERALAHAEDTIRQLQTRLAHAEMARAEVAAAPMPAPVPVPVQKPVEEPAPRRARRKQPNEAGAPAARVAAADETEEAVEWWRPGWRERLRSAR